METSVILRPLTQADLPADLVGFSVLTLLISPECWLKLAHIEFTGNFKRIRGHDDLYADTVNTELCRHKDDPLYGFIESGGTAASHSLADLGMLTPPDWTGRSFSDTEENRRALTIMVLSRDIAGYAKVVGMSERNVRAYIANATAQFRNMLSSHHDEKPVH